MAQTLTLYASRTGTRRNLEQLARHGWRLLLSPAGCLRPEGFRYALDNGAWSAHTQGRPFDGARFMHALARFGDGADWTAVPDVVGDCRATRELADQWLPHMEWARPMFVLQDGATEREVLELAPRLHGVFLGGSTEYKLESMERWGRFARRNRLAFHVGRVNSEKRIRLARVAGASSIDGSGPSRFAVVVPRLTRAARCALESVAPTAQLELAL